MNGLSGTPPELICLGEALFEFSQRPGATAFDPGFGGDTSNCAVAAARQGASVGYCSAVGMDMFGDALINLWTRESIDIAMVKRDPEAPTGCYYVTHDRQGHHFHYQRQGSAASRMTAADISPLLISQASILHFSAISQAISQSALDLTFHALELARSARLTVSYDTNLRLKLWSLARARAIIHETVRQCDIVKLSLEDAQTLSGLKSPDGILDYYLGMAPKIIMVTMGSSGTLIGTPSMRKRIPALEVKTLDATGAGDVFIGAFLAEYLRLKDIVRPATYAAAAAGLSTQGFGAVAPIPQRMEVELAMAQATWMKFAETEMS